jgi:hypothetical protein
MPAILATHGVAFVQFRAAKKPRMGMTPRWVSVRQFVGGAADSLDGGKGMHSKNVTFRPRISVRHMHRAKQCMPNSRMMSEG